MDERASNTARFYHSEYDKAYKMFLDGEKEASDDACCELISDFQCPRLLQIQAWQLRSVCTEDYWLARSHLINGLDLIASLQDDEEPLVKQTKEHTTRMLEQRDAEWKAYWAETGQDAPKEQRMEDTYVVSGSREEHEMGESSPQGDRDEAAIEKQRERPGRLELGEKDGEIGGVEVESGATAMKTTSQMGGEDEDGMAQ
ncbi:hypothetical protein M409DRAFT_23643 [Zasmidium cellare ATCC 36951]|uniref:Uncharacterized protein n=1 Tax=Zasmidium cellare ATCC 36951 TaxID=1080233 RepID=A0A6A6CFS5_ZASCE|nr:uncharacterized protein M409DRAFT_23643 [Zasmidium cellare ATCC 36951]KAF2165911.1 hypothetical protein M409DRAFT_23643 [Zasmidium cellare ATCC 36951]